MNQYGRVIVFLFLMLPYALSLAVGLQCPPVDAQGKRRIDAQAIAILEQCNVQSPITKTLYFNRVTQHYTPDREKLHQAMIQSVLAHQPCAMSHPIAILTAGGPGSGKTFFLTKKLPWVTSKTFVMIDADQLRSRLPEYKGWNTDKTQAEVKDIIYSLMAQMDKPCRHNFVYDSTLSNVAFFKQFIAKLKRQGYVVYIIYMQIPLEQSVQRALTRYQQEGRFVPPKFIRNSTRRSMATFQSIKHLADGYMVVNGLTYETIERSGKPLEPNT